MPSILAVVSMMCVLDNTRKKKKSFDRIVTGNRSENYDHARYINNRSKKYDYLPTVRRYRYVSIRYKDKWGVPS